MQLFVCCGRTITYSEGVTDENNESVADDMIASDVETADDKIAADSGTVTYNESVTDSLSSAASVNSLDVECRPLS